MGAKHWTAEDESVLRACYPHWRNTSLAQIFGRPAKAIGLKARKMGLKKSPDLKAGQFQPGHATWNAGKKGSTGLHPNCRATQFRPKHVSGQAAFNLRPIGAHLLNKDGTVLRKVASTGNRRNDWRPVHALVWESVHGPVPKGSIVVFKPGAKTADPDVIRVEHLELITRAENMRRNSYHNKYPKDVALLIQLRGALNRKINNRSKSA